MSRIVVTGAGGFIAGYLLPRLRADGHDVVELGRAQGDVADARTWRDLAPADIVVHLAGRSFVPDSWKTPDEYLRVNLLGTQAALDYCRRHEARLVLTSSYLYGLPARLPISEDAPVEATNPYALSKLLAEQLATFYAAHCGVPSTTLRLFNVYGARQSAHFLIPTIVRQVEAGEIVRVKDLAPRRDYVHVSDVVDAIARTCAGPAPGRVYNLGSGVSHSVGEVIAAIQKVWGTALDVICDDARRPGEIPETLADISAARRDLGWQPGVTLDEGLRQMRA
jgi:nucleoside-diphosphate-sugar epimerase